ncbi:transposase [Streptomyces decoyicus]|uniref:transposase n=1 Tax=Streptomyces decoyicus TaxID=249567 RepID=UPI0033FEA8FD
MGRAAHPALIRACAHLRCRESDDDDAVPRMTRFPLRLPAERTDNPVRLDSEATFAALRGVNPVERSSGGRRVHRLKCGANRQAKCGPLPDYPDPPAL